MDVKFQHLEDRGKAIFRMILVSHTSARETIRRVGLARKANQRNALAYC